jgi:FkbM family methyltransferase
LRTASFAYGVRLLCRVVPKLQWKVVALRLKGVPHPILLRPGTSDWDVLHQIFVAEDYNSGSEAHETSVSDFYEGVLNRLEIPVIVDCGANIGISSVWYAQRYPRARIIAVEPEPENFRILSMNAANYPNITPVQGGISDRQTRVSLTNAGDAPWAWETKESNDDGEIATFTIPNLLATIPGSRLMTVKIDIEGSEVELFRSNLDWSGKAPLIVFEAHDRRFAWRGTFHAIAAALTHQPRDYIQKGENTFAFCHLSSSDQARQT